MAEKKITKADAKKPAAKTLTGIDKVTALRKDLSDARRSLAASELPNPRVIINTRREIARALTEINAQRKKEKADA